MNKRQKRKNVEIEERKKNEEEKGKRELIGRREGI